MSHEGGGLPAMIGRDPAMLEVSRLVRLAARGDLPVLVVGETGTGKELVARALHDLSASSGGPFVDINCAALPDTLAEAELFGAERGAYTGATQATSGFLETANRGTLFLDEACSLSATLQAKLLRAIELQVFWRVGGRERRRSRFRLVSAIARPVNELVSAGHWRTDFAHRVAGFTIAIPPLRARRGDIPRLAAHFLSAREGGQPCRCLAPDAIELLGRYDWPGNVRELKALMERLRLAGEGPDIRAAELAELLPSPRAGRGRDAAQLFRVLAESEWNTRKAAKSLGVSRATLYRRIKEHGLAMPDRAPAPVS